MKKILKLALIVILILPLVAWPSCNRGQQETALRANVNIYNAAIGAGNILKSFHTTGQLDDVGYRASLIALNETRLVLREMTDAIEALPEVDVANKAILQVFITRAGDSLRRLAQVGALHLSPERATQFIQIVEVGIVAAQTIYTFVSKIKSPTKLPPLPARIDGTDVSAWLAVEVR